MSAAPLSSGSTVAPKGAAKRDEPARHRGRVDEAAAHAEADDRPLPVEYEPDRSAGRADDTRERLRGAEPDDGAPADLDDDVTALHACPRCRACRHGDDDEPALCRQHSDADPGVARRRVLADEAVAQR